MSLSRLALAAGMPFVWYLALALVYKQSVFVTLTKACFLELVAWFLWTTFVYPHFLSPLRHIPTPKGNHWLWGHGFRLLREPQGNPSKEWLTQVDHNGIIRYFTFFNRERLIVYSPKALADIYVTNCYAFHKPAFLANPMRIILGNGLLLSEGEEHKIQKKGLLPAFTRRGINALYPVFSSKVRETIHAMSAALSEDEAGEVDIANWAARYALDVIGLAGLGKDFGAIQDNSNPLVKTYHAVFKVSKQQRAIFLLNAFLPWWLLRSLPIKHNRDFSQASKNIRRVCQDIIEQQQAKFNKGGKLDADVLSIAIQSRHFSQDGLVNQAMTFLAAGHETTESSIIWAVYILACHPEIQQRLRDEIRENLPPIHSAGHYTSADINCLSFLRAVCNETLRLFSPVRLTMREASRDTYLQNVPVARGTKVMISSCATNTDPTLWGPDAAEFNPYRWLTRNDAGKLEILSGGGATTNYAMLTFSQGHRSCIGQGLARAEFACLVAGWIGRFEFRLKDEALMDMSNVKIRDGITAKPANGMQMLVKIVPGY